MPVDRLLGICASASSTIVIAVSCVSWNSPLPTSSAMINTGSAMPPRINRKIEVLARNRFAPDRSRDTSRVRNVLSPKLVKISTQPTMTTAK